MISTDELSTLPGTTVYGSDGEKIGRAGQAYVDDRSGQPEWVTVDTGLFGTKETFVPLHGAQLSGEGLTVPYTRDHVTAAPNVDPESGHLDESEEQILFQHYGVDNGSVHATEGVEDTEGAVGHDTPGADTDQRG